MKEKLTKNLCRINIPGIIFQEIYRPFKFITSQVPFCEPKI